MTFGNCICYNIIITIGDANLFINQNKGATKMNNENETFVDSSNSFIERLRRAHGKRKAAINETIRKGIGYSGFSTFLKANHGKPADAALISHYSAKTSAYKNAVKRAKNKTDGILEHCIPGGFDFDLVDYIVKEWSVKHDKNKEGEILVSVNPEYVLALLMNRVKAERIFYLLPNGNGIPNCPDYSAGIYERKLLERFNITIIEEFPTGIHTKYKKGEFDMSDDKTKGQAKRIYEIMNKGGFKAVFGNPPYSSFSEKNDDNAILLWNHFSETAMKCINKDGEVNYITPIIFNGAAKKFMDYAQDKVYSVDLNVGKHFDVYSPVCLWRARKNNNKGFTLITKQGERDYDSFNAIKYIPAFVDDTLSIHQKGWAKDSIGFDKHTFDFINPKYKHLIKRNQSDEFCYPVYSTSIHRLYWTNEEGKNLYGKLFSTPKLIVGSSTDNTAFFDEHGEYATTHMSYFLEGSINDLRTREKHLSSKFAKFWFWTGRQECAGDRTAGLIYLNALHLFPDIPLSITDDQDIYKWLGLTQEEIDVVEKFASESDIKNDKRIADAATKKAAKNAEVE